MAAGTFNSGDDSPRLVVPRALAAVLQALIEDERVAGYPIAELQRLRRQLMLVYRLKDPVLNEVELAQTLAEEDGIPQEDAP
jgi:hypothetical protein